MDSSSAKLGKVRLLPKVDIEDVYKHPADRECWNELREWHDSLDCCQKSKCLQVHSVKEEPDHWSGERVEEEV